MTWQGIDGHDDVVERLRRAFVSGRLGNAYLLVGPSGIGKRLLARTFAQALLCLDPPGPLEICGRCESCRQLGSDSHPDFQSVACPDDRRILPLELLIGDREHRSREGLCFWINLAPTLAPRKVAIIEDADALAEEGANALLKTLEEPPAGSVLFLVSHNLQQQLPTIRSRCQLLFCSPLEQATLSQLILSAKLTSTREQAQRLADLSAGSLDTARELSDPAWLEFLEELERLLADAPRDGVALAKEVISFVEQVDKATPPRRTRFRQVLRLVIESLRRELCEVSQGGNEWQQREVMRQIEHSIAAMGQIDANAHLPTLIDSWAEALASQRPAEFRLEGW